LKDNYSYVIENGNNCVVVDPSEAPPIQKFLRDRGLSLEAIFLTHHHWDHVGGAAELKSVFQCPIFGFQGDVARAPIDRPVDDQELLELDFLRFRVLHIPGHTLGHIAYVLNDEAAVFCGDTLFALGCGRLFEGTPEQMTVSLQKLAALNPSCQVYCGHEYTFANLEFAKVVAQDPLRIASDILQKRMSEDQRTIPSNIGFERQWNPFITAVLGQNPVARFADLRSRKDQFRG
jgi:hydroxyacylglutathione hydrolase